MGEANERCVYGVVLPFGLVLLVEKYGELLILPEVVSS
jgi:hypothetical protein